MKKLLTTLGVSALAVLTGMGALPMAHGQGILYPTRPIMPPHPQPRPIYIQPFYVKNLKVNAVIRDAVAETTVEQTFVNDSPVEQEATYLFPLPEGAMPTAFSMSIGDRTIEPRILTKEEARSIYESIVRQRRDPALLEYIDRNLVRVNVYPLPAHGERVIRMRYTQVLKQSAGTRRYAYPLSTSRFGSRPVGAVSVSIKLATSAPLKNVYSPSHDVSLRRPDDRTATASWEGRDDASDRDLALFYSVSDDDVGLSFLTYRSGDRDGYFMLLASPRIAVPKERILPKQVVFVLDRTGSMAGEKIKQARRSLLYCLNSLRPEDRFNVITFNESPDLLYKKMEPATEANVAKARKFVENVEASGGTNIDESLRAGLKLVREDPGTQKMLVFLTDGLPTVGETDVNTILRHAKESAGGAERGAASARIFCFGLGLDVNVPFLDRLGEMGRGDADYVKPEEDIEVKVSAFFSKVASPILANLRLDFEGADVYDLYPKTFPDLFKGSQLVVTGRFRNGGGKVKLSGLAGRQQESFTVPTGFERADGEHSFLPRIWATRKIGYLIDQIRLAENPAGRQEVINEIVRLSRDYGIITEYTSFLADEREQIRLGLRDAKGNLDFYALEQNGSLLREEIAGRATQFGVQGRGVTDQSLRGKDLSKADKAVSRYQNNSGGLYTLNGAVSGPPSGVFYGKRAPGNFGDRGGGFGGAGGLGGGGRAYSEAEAKALRITNAQEGQVVLQGVGDKTFYRQANNLWQDHAYDAKKQKLVQIQAFSEAHFALLRAVPRLAEYSSVGDNLIIRLGKNAVQIGTTGKEKLTAAEIRELTL